MRRALIYIYSIGSLSASPGKSKTAPQPLTVDNTKITVDSTKITSDQTEN